MVCDEVSIYLTMEVDLEVKWGHLFWVFSGCLHSSQLSIERIIRDISDLPEKRQGKNILWRSSCFLPTQGHGWRGSGGNLHLQAQYFSIAFSPPYLTPRVGSGSPPVQYDDDGEIYGGDILEYIFYEWVADRQIPQTRSMSKCRILCISKGKKIKIKKRKWNTPISISMRLLISQELLVS